MKVNNVDQLYVYLNIVQDLQYDSIQMQEKFRHPDEKINFSIIKFPGKISFTITGFNRVNNVQK